MKSIISKKLEELSLNNNNIVKEYENDEISIFKIYSKDFKLYRVTLFCNHLIKENNYEGYITLNYSDKQLTDLNYVLEGNKEKIIKYYDEVKTVIDTLDELDFIEYLHNL